MCLDLKNNLYGLFFWLGFMSSSFIIGIAPLHAASSTDFGPAHVGETSITLYPNSALVTTQIVLDRNHPQLHIVLPTNADTSTFTLNTTGRRIVSMEERRQKAVPSSEIAELLATRKDLMHELALLDAEDKVLDSQAAFWAKADPNVMISSNYQEGLKLLDAMADNLQKRTENLVVARHRVTLERQKIEEDMRDVENTIKSMGASAFLNGTPLVPVMVVYFDASAIPDTEAARAHMYPDADANTAQPVMNMVNLAATYSYVMRGCGWTPIYRFEAFADSAKNSDKDVHNGTIMYDAMAAIHQNSGAPWHNVNLSLASTMPSRRMAPHNLTPWHVNEHVQVPAPRATNMAEKHMAPVMASNAMMSESADFAAADSMPVQQDKATFSTWDLGKQSIPSGEVRTITLSTDRIPAKFYRLIRPSLEKASYLAADITLPEKTTMPAGKALHILHGAVLGEQYFTPQGRDMTLYFGQDPKVYATMTPRTISSGNDGVFDRKQTHMWSWDIAIHNDHATDSSSLPIKIEEAAPQLHHEDFSVTLDSTPAPLTKMTTKGKTYLWSLNVAPQSTTVIKHELILHAPENMTLDTGRGLQ